jgi:hypothetical protein
MDPRTKITYRVFEVNAFSTDGSVFQRLTKSNIKGK